MRCGLHSRPPDVRSRACLILARLAGTKLNTAIVKAFVNAISFFPIGSVVRTDRDEDRLVIEFDPVTCVRR